MSHKDTILWCASIDSMAPFSRACRQSKAGGSLMQKMGLAAIYPKSKPIGMDKPSTRPNQVWATDITYIRLSNGFVYLVAVMDWFSRYVVSWELSNSLDVYFCLSALDKALSQSRPLIFNNVNLLLMRLPLGFKRLRLPSVGTAEAAILTTSSLSVYGAVSSMRKSISTTMTLLPRLGVD